MSRERILSILLVIVGLVNFAPVLGLLGAERLAKLYGIGLLEGDLLTLMTHRAVLFGIIGAFIIYAAFKRPLQAAAMLMAAASMVGYMGLVYLAPESGVKLVRVAVVDVFACIILLLAALLYRRN